MKGRKIGINLTFHSFTMVESNFENCLYKTPQIRINLTVYSFTIVERNFENCLYETPQIGINLTVYSFTMVEKRRKENFEIGLQRVLLQTTWGVSNLLSEGHLGQCPNTQYASPSKKAKIQKVKEKVENDTKLK